MEIGASSRLQRSTAAVASRPYALPIAALGLGALHALAFQPTGWWWLAALSIGGLLTLWVQQTHRTWSVLATGLLFGLALDAASTSWLWGAMGRHPQAPDWVKAGGTLFAFFYDALPWLLAATTQVVFRHWDIRWRLLVAAPSGALLGWWLNTWLFGGLPWVAPAYGFLDTVFTGYFPVGGYLLVSLVVFWWAACAVLACHGQRCWWLGVVALPLLGWGLQQVPWAQPVSAPVKIGIVQTQAPFELDPPADTTRALHAMNLRISKALVKRHHAEVIVWPEGALRGSADEWSAAMARGLSSEFADTDFILGMLVTEPAPTDAAAAKTVRRFNIALAGGPHSSGRHAKHFLLPFGEYWPQTGPVAWFAKEHKTSAITPGPERQAPMVVRGQPVAASICYEDAYAAPFAMPDTPPAWLVNLSDDAWFDGDMPYQHMAMSRARAMELGRYLVRAANVGPSAIIAPNGKVLAQTKRDEVAMLAGEVTPLQGLTPFARWGHDWLLLWAAVVAGCTVWQLVRKRLAR